MNLTMLRFPIKPMPYMYEINSQMPQLLKPN